MSLLQRLFRPKEDERAPLRPLWARIVTLARDPLWYTECGIADSRAGRFDMLSLATALVLLRLENDEDGQLRTARLTELFVEDLEGQLRQEGIGDPTVGKRMGGLISALGGRTGALREALASSADAVLVEAARRNATFAGEERPELLAPRLRALHRRLEATPLDRLLAGELAP